MSLVAVTPWKMVAGVDAPGFRDLTYDWRAPPGDAANTKGVKEHFTVSHIDNALRDTNATDAHFVCYVLHEGGQPATRQPRINKAGLSWIREQGFEVGASVLVADCDNPGHGEWTPELRGAFDKLRASCAAFASAGIYLTAHGYRVVQPMNRALPVERFEVVVRAWLMSLEAAGVAVDHAAADWTRMFRSPNVRRDGKPYKSEMWLERMRSIEPPAAPNGPRVEGKRRARRAEGVVTLRELPASWAEHVGKLAAPLLAGGYAGQRHDVTLALGGALLARRVPAEYVPAIVDAVARAAAWDATNAWNGAEASVHRWAAGDPVKGAAWLRDCAPHVLEALDVVVGRSKARPMPAPDAPVVTFDDETERLENAIRSAPDGVTLLHVPCGFGKTRAIIKVALERAQKQYKNAQP